MPLNHNTAEKVRKQVEFYFSDSNAPRDKFLLEKINKHPEGYVDLATICAFSRMLSILNLPPNQKPEEVPNATIAKVAEALTESTELEVSEDKDHVKRKVPLKNEKEVVKEIDERSIYAAPFPYDSTLDELTAFFNEIAPVRCVRMRRHLTTKDFRGSVFVEFESKEIAQRVVEKEEGIVYAGATQTLEYKTDFLRRKYGQDAQKRRNTPQYVPEPYSPEGKRKRVQPANGAADEAHPSPQKPKTEAPLSYTKGLALKIALPPELVSDEQLNYQEIKTAIGGREVGVGHIEYTPGEATAYARMYDPERADAIIGKADAQGKWELQMCGKSIDVEISKLEGDEEMAFHSRAEAKRKAAQAQRPPGGGEFNFRKKGGRGRGRGRGGRRGGRRGRVV